MRTTDGVEAGHVRTLDSREVFAAHRERHMAVHAVHLLVGVGVSNNVGLGLVAVLAGLTDSGLGVVVLPIVAGHFVRIVAGHATHTLFIVLGHHELRAFGTAGRARRLRLDVEALFKLALSGRKLVVAFDEVGTLVATFAVRLEAVGFSANQVAAGTVAFFAGNTARNRVLLQFLGVAKSLEEFVLRLKVKLERVADFAVGGSGLEQQSLFVGRTVGGHTPLVRSRRTELAQFSREIRNNLLNFLGLFGGEPLCPTAGELVAAGKLRIGLSITFRQEFRTTGRNLVHTLDGAFFSILKHRVILEKVVPHFLFLDDVVLERLDAHFLFSRRRIVPNLLRNGINGLGAEARARRGSLYTRRNQSSGAKQRCSRRFDHFCCHLNLLNLF